MLLALALPVPRSRPRPPRLAAPAATTGAATDVTQTIGDAERAPSTPTASPPTVPLRVRHHDRLRPADARRGRRRRRRAAPRRPRRSPASRRTRPTTTGRRHQRGRRPPTAQDGTFTDGRRAARPGRARAPGPGRSARGRWSCARRSTPTAPRPATTSSTAARAGSARARPSARCATGDSAVAITEPLGRLVPYTPLLLPRRRDQRGRHRREPHAHVHDLARAHRDHPRPSAGQSTAWGDGVEVFGRVSGTGRSGIPVGLERQDFPFAGPFSTVGHAAGGQGRPLRALPDLRPGAVLRHPPAGARRAPRCRSQSPTVDRAGAREGRRGGRARARASACASAALVPAMPHGPRRAAAPQRRAAGGPSSPASGSKRPTRDPLALLLPGQAPRGPRALPGPRDRASDGGEHVPGTSRSLKVKPAARRR